MLIVLLVRYLQYTANNYMYMYMHELFCSVADMSKFGTDVVISFGLFLKKSLVTECYYPRQCFTYMDRDVTIIIDYIM